MNKYQKYLPFLMIVCGAFAVLSIPIIQGRTFFWGTPALQFIPWWTYAFDRIMQGELPFLNPFSGMEAPLLANYQSAIFYPFTWLSFPFYLIGDSPFLAWSINITLFIHICIGGIGMAFLIKQWSGTPAGMVIGGLAFSLSGYWICRLNFFSMIFCGMWLPWEMYFVNQILLGKDGKKRKDSFFFFVLVLCLQLLSGHAQLTWYSISIILLWTGTFSIFQNGIHIEWDRIRNILLGLILACGLAAVQLIPTAEYLLQSQRAGSVDYVKALAASFWPWHLFNFIAPNLFGSPANGDYWGYYAYWEDAVYIGIFPLICSLMTLFYLFKSETNMENKQNWKNNKFLFVFGWIIIAGTFILSLGYYSPVFPFLFKYVPTFGLFNAPSRMMVLVVLMLSWFSGIGISLWERPLKKQRKWIKRLMVGSISIILGAVYAKFTLPFIQSTIFTPVIFFGLLLLGSLIFILKKSEKENKRWNAGLVLFVMLDLILSTWLFNPTVPLDFYQRKIDKESKTTYQGRIFIDQKNEYLLKFTKYLRFKDFSSPGDWIWLRSALLPNINMLDGIYSANNFDPLLPDRFQNWLDKYDQANQEQKDIMLKNMDVQTLLVTDLEKSDNGITKIEKRTNGLVRWASCAQQAKNPEEALLLTINNPESQMVVTEDLEKKDFDADCIPVNTEIKILTAQAERIILEIQNKKDGWIWISNTYYPGWEMKVDNISNPIEKINFLFFGGRIKAGTHIVEFTYYPKSFYLGLLIAIISLILLIMFKFSFMPRINKQGQEK